MPALAAPEEYQTGRQHSMRDTAEIRMRAERRLGKIIRLQKETDGLAKGGQPYQATGAAREPVATTLADAGIDKKLSGTAPLG